MQFSSEQVQQFKQQGYLAVPQFWSGQEIRAIQLELERLVQAGKLRNVSTDGDGATHSRDKVNLQVCPVYKHSDLFRAMAFAPKAISAVSQLIGEPFLLHLDQVFLKPGRHGAGTNWHQDNAYFKISDPLMGTAMWTAVHDATAANGTLRVIPGVFREKFEHSRDPFSDHHIRCYPPEEQAVTVELPAGGVVFFCYGTPHCTGANNTDRDRAGVALHFLRTDFTDANLIDRTQSYHPVLTGPEASGGMREYGTLVGGTWEREVATRLEARGER